MDEKAYVRRIFSQAMAASARKSREDMPWTVMQRVAEALPDALRGGSRPLETCLHLLEAILEGFPTLLPDDPDRLHGNAVHSLAHNLLSALRQAKSLRPAPMDSVHRAHLDGVADTLLRLAAEVGGGRQAWDGADRARCARELTALAHVVRHALRGVEEENTPRGPV
ncbi:MAG: hypothetical protein AB7E47_07980 [Desulfovibrionaceae bacterium]